MEHTYITRLLKAMDAQGTYGEEYKTACARYAMGLLERGLPVIFDGQHVNEILLMWQIKFPYYTTFLVTSRDKIREITAPSLKLKKRQRWILRYILERFPVETCCHGFHRGRSIVTNARMHMGQKQILTMDVSDFFPSITEEQAADVFRRMGYAGDAAGRLADICCYQGALPQGAPTSPYLANLVCAPLDRELTRLADSLQLVYTRYADDLTFSGGWDLEPLIPLVEAALLQYGFKANRAKTRIYKDNSRKLVTGIVVKDRSLKVPKRFKRKLRQEIYYCKRFGVSTHLDNTRSAKRVNFKEYLYGKAYYVKMVEPEAGQRFLRDLDSISW